MHLTHKGELLGIYKRTINNPQLVNDKHSPSVNDKADIAVLTFCHTFLRLVAAACRIK